MTPPNDGNRFKDVFFWRNDSYPPYPQEEMQKIEQVIDLCHKNGFKITPAFSCYDFSSTDEEFKKNEREWLMIISEAALNIQTNRRENCT
jgi:hypothetical protein